MTNSLGHLIRKDLYTSRDPALLCGDETVSYSQLFNAVAACAQRLREDGIKPGDRVGIAGRNSPDYIIVLLGLWAVKAVACPLSIRLPEEALGRQLRQINARYLIASDDGLFNSQKINVKKLRMPGLTLTSAAAPLADLRCAAGLDATILFTSGSGGDPKAVLHTLENHVYSAGGANEHIPVGPGDRWLLSLPLYHVGGLGIVFRVLLGRGAVAVPEPRENIAQAIERHHVTHVSLVPTQLFRLLGEKDRIPKLKSLKAVLLGGSFIPDSLLRESLKMGLPVYASYGLTEMASQAATSRRLTTADCVLSAGILNYRQVRISDEGEILVKGETLFKGYVDGGKTHLPVDREGWFATGDLGCLAGDGGLIVTGRRDNMFISGGENIHPEEIEKCLCRLNGIEAAVVVPVEDDEFGCRPVAFVKTNDALSPDKILTFLQSRLPKFKIPKRFYAWPEKEGKAGCKFNRQRLRQFAAERCRLLQES